MSDYLKQLEDLKAKAQKNKEEKIRLEQQLKGLEDQQNKINTELKELNVEPENLSSTIQEIEEKIEKELGEITELLSE